MVESVIPLHTKIFQAVHRRIHIPIQTYFGGFFPTPTKRKVTMGRFYEGVSWALYGGTLNDKKIDLDFFKGGVRDSLKPDGVDKKLIWESKANHSGHSCNLVYGQIEAYQRLQYSNPSKETVFHIYRHSLDGIGRVDRTEEEVIGELLEKTSFLVTLPLNILLGLRENGLNGNQLARNYVGKTDKQGYKVWPDTLCINSPTINRFLTDSEENLRTLHLDPARFEILRYLSPPNLTVNGGLVRQFPIVRVVDKKYRSWVNQFRAEYSKGIMAEKNRKRRERRKEGKTIIIDENGNPLPF